MMTSLWPLDHVAHVVRNLDLAIERFGSVLTQNLPENASSAGAAGQSTAHLPHYRETLPAHKVEVAFIDLENSSIELIMPLAGNTSLEKFLAKRGEALHHICFRVPSVAQELTRLAAQGIELIDTSPRPGARGTEVAFLHPRSAGGVLIEICCEITKPLACDKA